MSEIWDLVDEFGNKTGMTCTRADQSTIPSGLYHPCVEVWVRSEDKLLITRRHPDKSEGLKYDCPGGAVLHGESILDGALRELYEETGIRAERDRLKYLGALTGRTAYAVSYVVHLDYMPEISLQPTEVVGYSFVTREQLEDMAEELTYGTWARYNIYKTILF